MQAVPVAAGIDARETLESGNVLIIPNAPFELAAEDLAAIFAVRRIGSHHKNIAYKPGQDMVSGLGKDGAPLRARLQDVLQRYSRTATEIAAGLLPQYQQGWRLDYASLRPVEEAGRSLPFKKRNDLLHTDAFPTRPTNGGLILRIFFNLHPERSRVWIVTDPFEKIAPEHAEAAGLGRITDRRHLLSAALRRLHLPVKARSPYDDFMLVFHDYLKHNAEFQAACPKRRLEFPPGTMWMAFTDIVPHSVVSGQFAMEQTLIVPRDCLASPERAPISVLERLAGHSLTLRRSTSPRPC